MSENESEPPRTWEEWYERATVLVERFQREQIQNGNLLPVSAFAERTGRTVADVEADLAERRLFSITFESVAHIPNFLCEPVLQHTGIDVVVTALSDLRGETKWEFFSNPRISLDGLTPIEALRGGRLEAVLRAAAGFAARI